jgi:aminoglycoside 3-N-acetyltransferase
MNIPTTSADDLRAHLHALGVQTGDHVTVHSRLLSFGYIDGGVASVFEMLREVVGPQGTIVVPTYTLSRGTT